MTMRATTILVVCFSYVLTAFADSEAMPSPVVFTSPAGNHYFRLIPSPDFDEKKAQGYLYRVAAEADELLYRTEGWYAFQVLVSNDGRYLARTGPWPHYDWPPEATPAVIFYADGAPVRTYFVSDLIEDATELEFSVSHYSWGGALKWLDGGWNDTLGVETVEDRKITFNIQTAEIVR